MNRREYLSRAAAGVGWTIAAFTLSATPGCGGSSTAIDPQIAQNSRDSLKDSLQYSQNLHKSKKKSSRRPSARR